MYLPSVILVGFYFEKKRALATGIAVCGTGIGKRPQFRLLEKKYQKIVRTETKLARFDWLLFTYKYWRVNQIWLFLYPKLHVECRVF